MEENLNQKKRNKVFLKKWLETSGKYRFDILINGKAVARVLKTDNIESDMDTANLIHDAFTVYGETKFTAVQILESNNTLRFIAQSSVDSQEELEERLNESEALIKSIRRFVDADGNQKIDLFLDKLNNRMKSETTSVVKSMLPKNDNEIKAYCILQRISSLEMDSKLATAQLRKQCNEKIDSLKKEYYSLIRN